MQQWPLNGFVRFKPRIPAKSLKELCESVAVYTVIAIMFIVTIIINITVIMIMIMITLLPVYPKKTVKILFRSTKTSSPSALVTVIRSVYFIPAANVFSKITKLCESCLVRLRLGQIARGLSWLELSNVQWKEWSPAQLEHSAVRASLLEFVILAPQFEMHLGISGWKWSAKRFPAPSPHFLFLFSNYSTMLFCREPQNVHDAALVWFLHETQKVQGCLSFRWWCTTLTTLLIMTSYAEKHLNLWV